MVHGAFKTLGLQRGNVTVFHTRLFSLDAYDLVIREWDFYKLIKRQLVPHYIFRFLFFPSFLIEKQAAKPAVPEKS